MSALLCAVAIFAAGCHRNNLTSGAGVAWVTLTDQPGDFASYIVNVNSITLTRSDGVPVGPFLVAETVDFTKLSDLSELWGSATIPVGTYLSASIVLDYTPAPPTGTGQSVIAVMVGGLPQRATVVDSTGKAVTAANGNALQTINVNLDTAGQLTVPATYATTSAQRLAIDFNLAASTVSINTATTPATVTVKPYLTVGVAPSDQKLIRVRGPLINSSVTLGTYTVYERPFLDEADNLGSLSLFVDANTIFTTNGVVTTGTPGITQLSQSSAGTTMTAAYTTFEPTATPTATAGIFHAKYVIAGSTLEDLYTSGLEGDVVARTGNTLTVRGSTLQLYNGGTIGTSFYGCDGCVNTADATVTLGPATRVTADGTTLTNLNYNSVAVGQHVIVRGICNNYNACTGVIDIDATGSTVNTGSVRLISTQLWGSLVSSVAGALSLNLQTVNDWPVSDFTFTGNGTSAATDPVATAFTVNTGTLTNPDTTVGDPLWIDGLVAPFGSAPPDFDATAISSESSVPASLQIHWTGTGTTTPFVLSSTGLSINLANASIGTAVIRVGPESIALASLPTSPAFTVVPQAAIASSLPGVALFTPRFSYGDPTAVVAAGCVVACGGIHVFSTLGPFTSGLSTALATTPALQMEAHGTYNRATNTFSASSVDVVL